MANQDGNAQLENLTEAGSPPKKRIKSSDNLISIADKYIEQDEDAASQPPTPSSPTMEPTTPPIL